MNCIAVAICQEVQIVHQMGLFVEAGYILNGQTPNHTFREKMFKWYVRRRMWLHHYKVKDGGEYRTPIGKARVKEL